jgi:hypothetical protein
LHLVLMHLAVERDSGMYSAHRFLTAAYAVISSVTSKYTLLYPIKGEVLMNCVIAVGVGIFASVALEAVAALDQMLAYRVRTVGVGGGLGPSITKAKMSLKLRYIFLFLLGCLILFPFLKFANAQSGVFFPPLFELELQPFLGKCMTVMPNSGEKWRVGVDDCGKRYQRWQFWPYSNSTFKIYEPTHQSLSNLLAPRCLVALNAPRLEVQQARIGQ